MSKNTDNNIVNAPISPLPCLLGNLILPVVLQYTTVHKFNYFHRINHYLPSLPSILTSSFPQSIQNDNNMLLWRGLFGSLFIIGGYIIQYSGKKAMAKLDVVPPHGKPVRNLVTGGSFQYTRNPLYLGGFIMTFGFSLLFNNWLMLVGMGGIYLYLQSIVIPNEEKGLTKFFGDQYKRYCKKVPRWLIGDFV